MGIPKKSKREGPDFIEENKILFFLFPLLLFCSFYVCLAFFFFFFFHGSKRKQGQGGEGDTTFNVNAWERNQEKNNQQEQVSLMMGQTFLLQPFWNDVKVRNMEIREERWERTQNGSVGFEQLHQGLSDGVLTKQKSIFRP